MGYKISVSINCYKCVDFTSLSGVRLLVYLEGETYSVLTLTSNGNGWAFDTLDRSQYVQSEFTGRVKAYYEKDGFNKGCVKLNSEGSFVDSSTVTNYSFSVDALLMEAEPEVLPPPSVEGPPNG